MERIPAQSYGANQADEDTGVARKLADQYQPMIIDAEKAKEDSDFHFQKFARLTAQVCRGRLQASRPMRAGPKPTCRSAASRPLVPTRSMDSTTAILVSIAVPPTLRRRPSS